ncbi:conserved hypothetical protein [Frankia canadensis]|uniref:Orn/DAP/Arg decarboxylase 2 N-terminal domain-containing protein n=1 Tax=Frankia canadensis TaxID=1836972 RepID=A0A2I2KW00_9ACTN|nr:hypothetical protein [Frankia canadensis]SNQ49826.1 conserved hypothetical protein [Frankia canadensis]SOU57116.1 conserved hypothetical protein [Frankia canadensis]
MPTARLRHFVATQQETPYAVLDVDHALTAHDRLVSCLDAAVQFSLKAQPDPTLLAAPVRRGAGLDVASPREIDLALAAGCPPTLISHGNPVRDPAEIRHAWDRGVRTFAVDSAAEVRRLARDAPGATVVLRLAHGGAGSDWPMSGRFGVGPGQAVPLALDAAAADSPSPA